MESIITFLLWIFIQNYAWKKGYKCCTLYKDVWIKNIKKASVELDTTGTREKSSTTSTTVSVGGSN